MVLQNWLNAIVSKIETSPMIWQELQQALGMPHLH